MMPVFSRFSCLNTAVGCAGELTYKPSAAIVIQIKLARVSIWAPFYRLRYSFCRVINGLPTLDFLSTIHHADSFK